MPAEERLERTYQILAERERVRHLLSHAPPTTSGLDDLLKYLVDGTDLQRAQEFYSIKRSKYESDSNRYPGEIFAFDRTTVVIRRVKHLTHGRAERQVPDEDDEGGYLNANVVRDDHGSWWVASQAPTVDTIHPFFMAMLTRSASTTYASLYSARKQPGDEAESSDDRTATPAILVQLTDFVEKGRKKADVYLPPKGKESVRHDPPESVREEHASLDLKILDRSERSDIGTVVTRVELSKVAKRRPGERIDPQTHGHLPTHEDVEKQVKKNDVPRFSTNPVARHRLDDWVESHADQFQGVAVGKSQGNDRVQRLKDPPVDDDGEDEDKGVSSMELWHYHFQDWPDHGVPTGQGVNELKGLIEEIGRKRKELGRGDPLRCEVWVHCSAGIGRTGTFIALSSLLLPQPQFDPTSRKARTGLLKPLPEELKDDPVARVVDMLRDQRGLMVQTKEQLGLVYQMTEGLDKK